MSQSKLRAMSIFNMVILASKHCGYLALFASKHRQYFGSILVFYNGLISIKIPMVICPYLYQNSTTFTIGLFPFKLCSYLDLFSLSINPQTPHNLRLLYRVSFYLNSFSYFMYLRLVVTVTFHSDHICPSSWITPSALSTLSNLFQYRSHTSSLP